MIEHCRDFRRLLKLCNWILNISSRVYYLVEVKNGKDLGVWGFHPFDDGLMVHVDMGESCRGKCAAESARNAFDWIFESTSAKVIYASIMPSKMNVRVLARTVGFEFVECDSAHNRLYKLDKRHG